MREVERQAPLRLAHPTPPAQRLLQAALGLSHPLRAVTKRVNYPTGLKEKLKIPHAPGPGQRAPRRPPHSLPPAAAISGALQPPRQPPLSEEEEEEKPGRPPGSSSPPSFPFFSFPFSSLPAPPRPPLTGRPRGAPQQPQRHGCLRPPQAPGACATAAGGAGAAAVGR